MTAATAVPQAVAPRLGRVRRWSRPRPELPLWGLVGGAWGVMAVLHLDVTLGPAEHPHGHHAPSDPSPAGTAAALGLWIVMVIAMMLPFSLPDARWLARRSLRSRRGHVLAAFVIGVSAPWIALGAVLVPLATAVAPEGRPLVAGGILVGAAWWHRSGRRGAALRRCGDLPAPAIRGWRADLSCARAGALRGRRCVITCGPTMAAMAFAPGLLLMVALTAIQWSEQGRGPDPHRRGARASHAAVLLVLAALVALVG